MKCKKLNMRAIKGGKKDDLPGSGTSQFKLVLA